MKKAIIESSVYNFTDLFSSGSFSVPWHQRKYDWKADNVKELLKDIQEALNDNDKKYFLGSVLLVEKSTTNWEVNDGQQRMATISMICAALYRVFRDERNCPAEMELCKKMLFIYSGLGYKPGVSDDLTNLKPRLNVSDFDKGRYRMIINGDDVSRNGKITRAWNTVLSFVEGLGASEAKKYLYFVANHVLIARMIVRDGIDPNLVFEVINSRGKQLDDFDLIRNHIYSFFGPSYSQERRKTVHGNLEAMYSRLKDSSMGYAECFFKCEFGHLPKESFYKKVKAKISEKKKNGDYVYDLIARHLTNECYGEIYRVIRTPSVIIDTPILKEFHVACGSPARRNISVLLSELQKYSVSYPILFALFRAFMDAKDAQAKKRTAKIALSHIRNLNAFVMRTAFVLDKFSPSRYAHVFSNLAQEFSREKDLRNVDLISKLDELDHSQIFVDKIFVEKLSMAKFISNQRPKAFLMGLAWGASHIVNGKSMSVEHILPDSDEHLSGWKAFDKAVHAECRYMLGNLTLLPLHVKAHTKEFNQNFEAKKGAFRTSGVDLTVKIADKQDWTPDQIRARQLEMAEEAVNVWKFEHMAVNRKRKDLTKSPIRKPRGKKK